MLIYYYNLLLFYIIIYNIIYISKEEDIINSISKIIITINGTENQSILSNKSYYNHYISEIEKVCYFNYTPDNILVNNISQKNKDKYVYNLTEQINNITIIFNNQIKDCCGMFYGLKNITKIDLSYFNTSLVTDMRSMFSG